METTERPAATALLLIDMVNPLDFEGADALFAEALPAARRIADLATRARAAHIPVIYANDNFGSWHVGFRELVDHVRQESSRGAALVEVLQPDPAIDHFVLKPMHSAFFQTGLEFLLQHLGVTRLILTGIAAEICVFLTANDAHMRRYRVIVPSDCVASERKEDHAYALRLMARLVEADTRPSLELNLSALAGSEDAKRPVTET